MNIDNQRSRAPSLSLIIILAMVVLAGLMMLHQASRSRNLVSPVEILLGTPQGPSGQVLAFTQEPVTVYLPPDAAREPGTISIALASPDASLISDNSGWIRWHVVNVEFRDPNGTTLSEISFSEPVEICFRLSAAQWDEFLSRADAYQVQHFVSQANPSGWQALPQNTYPARRQLCGQTTHLSLFSLAVRGEFAGTVSTSPSTVSTLVATRTPVQSAATQQRRRDGASSEGSLGSAPTAAPPPTNPPSTATQPAPPPTEIPPTVVPPTEPPPATEVPTEAPTEEPTEEPSLPGLLPLPIFPSP